MVKKILKSISNYPYLKILYVYYFFKNLYCYIYTQILVYKYILLGSFSVALMYMVHDFLGVTIGFEQKSWRSTLSSTTSPSLSNHKLIIALHLGMRLCEIFPILINTTTRNALVQVIFGKPYNWAFMGLGPLS